MVSLAPTFGAPDHVTAGAPREVAAPDPLDALGELPHIPRRHTLPLRAAMAWLRQAGLLPDPVLAVGQLLQQPNCVAAWLALFSARFDPRMVGGLEPRQRELRFAQAEAALQDEVLRVDDLTVRMLLTRLREFVHAIARTNFYLEREDGTPPAVLAFKIVSSELSFLSGSRPYRECFLYSERMEGVHLRDGAVACGVLEVLDRAEDCRQQALAQARGRTQRQAMAPFVGAHGAYAIRDLPSGPRHGECSHVTEAVPAAIRAAHLEARRGFIEALFDVTDMTPGGDDAFLALAPDAATADFAELADELSETRAYWVGDAFGCSPASDELARRDRVRQLGGWECARARLAALAIRPAVDPFTAIAVGRPPAALPVAESDGLEAGLCLLAAFDDDAILLDPTPISELARAERRRLASLPGATWADYAPTALGAGGGVWSRRAALIPLDPGAMRLLGVDVACVSPDDLLSAILRLPADLLIHAGSVELSGPADMRVRAVAELAEGRLSHPFRLELARRGVLVATHDVDAAAAADYADRELCARLAIQRDPGLMRRRKWMLPPARDYLARQAALAARAQARRLLRLARHPELIPARERFLDALRRKSGAGALDGMSGELLSPELAGILSLERLTLKDAWQARAPGALLPWHEALLQAGFPPSMRHLPLLDHPLARPMLASTLANEAIHRLGAGVLEHLCQLESCDVVRGLDALAFAWTGLRLDAAVCGDDRIAELPAAAADLEESQAEMLLREAVCGLLVTPALLQPRWWNELRARVPSSATLGERVDLVMRLRRALPLVYSGSGIDSALQLVEDVEQATGFAAISRGVIARMQRSDEPSLLRWLDRRFEAMSLRVAFGARKRRGPAGVSEALDELGWRRPLARLRLEHEDFSGPDALERIFALSCRLDDASAITELCMPASNRAARRTTAERQRDLAS